MRGEPVDRVPLKLEGLYFADKDEARDPGKREIVERTHDQVHFFHSWPSLISRYLVTPPQCTREVERVVDGDTITGSAIVGDMGAIAFTAKRKK
jgi:hypothetical protein